MLIVAPHQDDGNEVHPVAMRALGRRPTDACGGIDAELVRLHVPRLHAAQGRAPLPEAAQQSGPGRGGDGLRVHRLEHAQHAAVQGVVVERLPVGTVGGLPHLCAIDDETGMATATVAAAVAQIVVGWQIIPARLERTQVFRARLRQRQHFGGGQYGVTTHADIVQHTGGIGQRREEGGRHRRILAR